MLILLDENLLSKKLKKPFLDVGHTVQNVEDMGWRGTKDRDLLALANVFPFNKLWGLSPSLFVGQRVLMPQLNPPKFCGRKPSPQTSLRHKT